MILYYKQNTLNLLEKITWKLHDKIYTFLYSHMGCIARVIRLFRATIRASSGVVKKKGMNECTRKNEARVVKWRVKSSPTIPFPGAINQTIAGGRCRAINRYECTFRHVLHDIVSEIPWNVRSFYASMDGPSMRCAHICVFEELHYFFSFF